MVPHEFTTLVLDLGGVLANYATSNTVRLLASQITSALDSPDWHDYEKGQISQQECYEKVCNAFGMDLDIWTETLAHMREGLSPNMDMISAIKELKQMYPKVKVFCLSNVPAPDLNLLKDQINSWDIIDQFVASSSLQQRKPDMAIFNAFLNIANASASSCIFVDERIESVVMAQILGFKGIHVKGADELVRVLHNLLGDPVARAKAFLKHNAKNLFCTLSTGQIQPDNYSQLLILQNTGDRDLVVLENERYTWNYFQGRPQFAGIMYPDDSDTTSLAMAVLDDIPMAEKLRARDEILLHLTSDGLPICWLSKTRPRFCHCICANIFRFFAINDWSENLPGVNEYLCRLLKTRAYLHGSRYYKNPDWLLYILSDLCATRPSDPQLQTMRDLLVECVYSRMGCDGDILGSALRVLSAQSLAIENKRDLEVLLESQQLDGGWELAWLYQYGSRPLKIGGRGVVTAMAMNAIQRENNLVSGQETKYT